MTLSTNVTESPIGRPISEPIMGAKVDKPTFGAQIGKIVEAELKRREWSQGQLALRVGCTQPVISALIAGKTKSPGSELLFNIAHALGQSAAMFDAAKAATANLPRLNPELQAVIEAAEKQFAPIRAVADLHAKLDDVRKIAERASRPVAVAAGMGLPSPSELREMKEHIDELWDQHLKILKAEKSARHARSAGSRKNKKHA